jgi:hypothetical protein
LQLESTFRYNLEQFLNTEDNIQNASIKQAIKVAMSADMSDGVKLKRPIHCPLFYRGFFISYAGHCRLAMSVINQKS